MITIDTMRWFKKPGTANSERRARPERIHPVLDTDGYFRVTRQSLEQGADPDTTVERVLVMMHPILLHDDDFDTLFELARRYPSATHIVWGGHTLGDQFPLENAAQNELHNHGKLDIANDLLCQQSLVHRSAEGEVWKVCYRDRGAVSLLFQANIPLAEDTENPEAAVSLFVASGHRFWVAYPKTRQTARTGGDDATRRGPAYLIRPSAEADINNSMPSLLIAVLSDFEGGSGDKVAQQRKGATHFGALNRGFYKTLAPEFNNVLNVPEHFLMPDPSDDAYDFGTLLRNMQSLIDEAGPENIKSLLIGDPRTLEEVMLGEPGFFDYRDEPYGDGLRAALREPGFVTLVEALPNLWQIVAVTDMELDFIAWRTPGRDDWRAG